MPRRVVQLLKLLQSLKEQLAFYVGSENYDAMARDLPVELAVDWDMIVNMMKLVVRRVDLNVDMSRLLSNDLVCHHSNCTFGQSSS